MRLQPPNPLPLEPVHSILVNHICLYLICCTSGVLSNIGYFSQRKKKRARELSISQATAVELRMWPLVHSSQITGAIPHVLSFFSFSPSLFLFLSFLNFSFFTFYELDFTFHSTLKDIRNSISAIQNVEIESTCIFIGDMWVCSLWLTAICCCFSWELYVNVGLILSCIILCVTKTNYLVCMKMGTLGNLSFVSP